MQSLGKFLVAAIMFSIAPQAGEAKSVGNQPIAATGLRSDLARLRAALLEGAAGLYRYRTKQEVHRILGKIDRRVTGSMSSIDFWRLVTPALASFDDGHLSVLLDQKVLAEYLRGREFPLQFVIVGDRLYVTEDRSNAGIAKGSEILTIDGMSAPQLIARCGAFIPADGGLRIRKLRKVERDFTVTCVPALGLGPNYDLVVRRPGEKPVRLQVKGASEPAAALNKSGATEASPSFYKLEFPVEHKIALLTLGSFVRSAEVNPEGAFAKIFSEIDHAGTTDLILDIRGSAGGRDSDGALLFSYLAEGDFRYVDARFANRDRFSAQDHSDALNALIAQIPHERQADGRILLRDLVDGTQHPQAKHAFRGRVYLIINGNTFSTASEFASVFKYYHRGPVIGEESGTAAVGGSGGPASLHLPNSGLTVEIPLAEYIMPGAKIAFKGHGVQPDYPIRRSLDDLISGRDRAKELALELIQKGDS